MLKMAPQACLKTINVCGVYRADHSPLTQWIVLISSTSVAIEVQWKVAFCSDCVSRERECNNQL